MNGLGFKQEFAVVLRAALKVKFGRLPSASFVSMQFNRRVTFNGVSSETVRRWMRGNCLPRCEHMEVLVVWLDIDMGRVLKGGRATTPAEVDARHQPPTALAQVISELDPGIQEALMRLVVGSPALFPRRNNRPRLGGALVST
jgi:hypothetical protein